jgi:hypothetical protein
MRGVRVACRGVVQGRGGCLWAQPAAVQRMRTERSEESRKACLEQSAERRLLLVGGEGVG